MCIENYIYSCNTDLQFYQLFFRFTNKEEIAIFSWLLWISIAVIQIFLNSGKGVESRTGKTFILRIISFVFQGVKAPTKLPDLYYRCLLSRVQVVCDELARE